MAQIFHRSTNFISRLTIYGAVVILGLLGFALYEIALSPWYTDQFVKRQQPVPFSHRHHAGELGIDCRYCHTSVEKSSFAGVPPTHFAPRQSGFQKPEERLKNDCFALRYRRKGLKMFHVAEKNILGFSFHPF